MVMEQQNITIEQIDISLLNPAPYNPRQFKICTICNTQFIAKKHPNQLYCSRVCSGIASRGKKATPKQLYSLSLGRYKGKKIGGWNWSEGSKLKLSHTKKGIKLTIQHKLSLSLAKKGKAIPHLHNAEVRQKIREALTGVPQYWLRGINHPNWKGGITPINMQIRSSLKMKEWRKKVFEKDDYTCQICGEHGGRLVADHIKPFSLYPELRFELSNGRTICKKCDLKSDTYGGRIQNYVRRK